jgi:hypothetical protein
MGKRGSASVPEVLRQVITTRRLAVATLLSIVGFWSTILIYELLGPPRSSPVAEPFNTVLGFNALTMIAITVFGTSLALRFIRQRDGSGKSSF